MYTNCATVSCIISPNSIVSPTAFGESDFQTVSHPVTEKNDPKLIENDRAHWDNSILVQKIIWIRRI